MKIFIRILAFVGLALAFVIATYWKIGVIEAGRTQEVVTIQGEYETYGRPVVTYQVDRGLLYNYEKITFRPIGKRTLQALVSNQSIYRLRIGQNISLMGLEATGRVQTIAPSPELLTGLYLITVSLDQTLENLPDQVIGRVKIKQHMVNVRVPRNALSRQDGQFYAWRVDGGRAYRTAVQVGKADELFYEITAGIKAGEMVVTKGHRFLQDQQKIRSVAEQDTDVELVERR